MRDLGEKCYFVVLIAPLDGILEFSETLQKRLGVVDNPFIVRCTFEEHIVDCLKRCSCAPVSLDRELFQASGNGDAHILFDSVGI